MTRLPAPLSVSHSGRRTTGALVVATAVFGGLTVLPSASADAAPRTQADSTAPASTAPASTAPASTAPAAASHNPVGGLSARTTSPTGLTLRGWALDPDTPTANTDAFATVDGVSRAVTPTSVPFASITKKYHAGPTPGFVMSVPVPSGKHTVCVGVRNLGLGTNVLVTCLATPLGRTVTASQIASHSPTGVVSRATATASSVRVQGFATDRDFLSQPQSVVLYVDGRSMLTSTTTATAAGAPAGSGRYASFDMTVPVVTGTHQACVWAVNIGWGRNTFLGCNALDTRAGQALAAGSPSVAMLPKVVAEAKKHIGQRYVWGATGPKTFDCSGLVVYSYKKYGFVTPRVSEDQARAARLIPASKAQPGDLVFYHDNEGDVYHVGIYLSPGLTVAAIDEAEGVNYQKIWYPVTATYGSFTHV